MWPMALSGLGGVFAPRNSFPWAYLLGGGGPKSRFAIYTKPIQSCSEKNQTLLSLAIICYHTCYYYLAD